MLGSGARVSPHPTPSKERSFSNLFKSSPTFDASGSKESRKPNKLQKKRAPDLPSVSAHSSTHSLSASGPSLPSSPGFPPSARGSQSQAYGERLEVPYRPPFAPSDDAHEHAIDDSPYLSAVGGSQTLSSNGGRSPGRSPVRASARGTQVRDMAEAGEHMRLGSLPQHDSEQTIRANEAKRSPTDSFSSAVDYYSLDNVAAEGGGDGEKGRRWRYSESSQKGTGHMRQSSNMELQNSTTINSVAGGTDRSMSSAGSYQRSAGGKSVTDESGGGNDAYEGVAGGVAAEKKSPFGWFKGKLQERKDRAKSPQPVSERGEGSASKQSLGAVFGGEQ